MIGVEEELRAEEGKTLSGVGIAPAYPGPIVSRADKAAAGIRLRIGWISAGNKAVVLSGV